MKKILLLLAIFAIDCNQIKRSTDDADLKNISQEFIVKIKEFYQHQPAEKCLMLDDVEIFAIDTLNARADSQRVFRIALSTFNKLNDEIMVRQNAMKNDTYNMRVISNYSSPSYWKYKKDYNQNNLKVSRLMRLCDKEIAHMKYLSKLIANKKVDTVAMTGYIVSFNAKGYTRANAPANLDSAILCFNMAKQLIEE
jgi:hypothetical protein